jgi:hypothetical protein
MQHLSIGQDPSRFVAASSLMGVRRALTSTAWGRKYIAWLYFCKVVLLLIAFLWIREPLFRVVLGYLAAYFSLMLVRDAVTLRDTYVLHRLGNPSTAPPEISWCVRVCPRLLTTKCAVKRAGLQRVKLPPGNWIASSGSRQTIPESSRRIPTWRDLR